MNACPRARAPLCAVKQLCRKASRGKLRSRQAERLELIGDVSMLDEVGSEGRGGGSSLDTIATLASDIEETGGLRRLAKHDVTVVGERAQAGPTRRNAADVEPRCLHDRVDADRDIEVIRVHVARLGWRPVTRGGDESPATLRLEIKGSLCAVHGHAGIQEEGPVQARVVVELSVVEGEDGPPLGGDGHGAREAGSAGHHLGPRPRGIRDDLPFVRLARLGLHAPGPFARPRGALHGRVVDEFGPVAPRLRDEAALDAGDVHVHRARLHEAAAHVVVA
mmetsp:Transcript_4084/g.10328  ORF Transcript_4084/g.10328 Transcript_4084/m.10328 type:complete len:278 (-) Transcript_4084:384-1217(-)